MRKILIVDDVLNNRRAIKLTLSDLEDIEFIEATNGREAIELAKLHTPHIVYMDVMMPEVDGIEATEILKSNPQTKDILIIGVTALDDHEIKKKMITAGVRDFINKPFDDQELILRTKSYLDLVDAKVENRVRRDNITLYPNDNSVKSFRVVFHVSNDRDINDIWEFFDKSRAYDKTQLSDSINIIVTVVKVLIKASKINHFDLILEEGDEFIYLTAWNKMFVRAAKKYFEKFGKDIEFVTSADKISFRILAFNVEAMMSEEAPIVTASKVPPVIVPQKIDSVEIIKSVADKVVYDFIDTDDLEDLQESIKDLRSKLLVFGNSELEKNDIFDIQVEISKIATRLKLYPQTFIISDCLESLANNMIAHIERYLENSSNIAQLFVGFGNDLELWLDSLFFSGTTDLHFLDDTITTNIETIKSFAVIAASTDGDESLDDIFDF